MANNDVEASRISDVDRDPKSLREKLQTPDHKLKSFTQDLKQLLTELKQDREEFKKTRQSVDRDLPRTPVEEMEGYSHRRREINKGFVNQHFLGSRTQRCRDNEVPIKQNHQESKFAEFSSITTEEKLPTFNGSSVKLDFLDWFDVFADYFEAVNPPDAVKCKLVASKLKGEARIWWKELQNNRFSKGKNLITSWSRMRELLLKRFLHTSRLTYFYKQENDDNVQHIKCLKNCPLEVDISSEVVNSVNISEDRVQQIVEGNEGKEPVIDDTLPSECLTEFQNQLNRQENEDAVMHVNCLIKCPVDVYSNKNEELLGNGSTDHIIEVLEKQAQGLKEKNECNRGAEVIKYTGLAGAEVVEHLQVNESTHAKCSMKVPLQPSSTGQKQLMSCDHIDDSCYLWLNTVDAYKVSKSRDVLVDATNKQQTLATFPDQSMVVDKETHGNQDGNQGAENNTGVLTKKAPGTVNGEIETVKRNEVKHGKCVLNFPKLSINEQDEGIKLPSTSIIATSVLKNPTFAQQHASQSLVGEMKIGSMFKRSLKAFESPFRSYLPDFIYTTSGFLDMNFDPGGKCKLELNEIDRQRKSEFLFNYFVAGKPLLFESLKDCDLRPLDNYNDAQTSVFSFNLQKRLEYARMFVVDSRNLGLMSSGSESGVYCVLTNESKVMNGGTTRMNFDPGGNGSINKIRHSRNFDLDTDEHDIEIGTTTHGLVKRVVPELEIPCCMLFIAFLIDQKRYNGLKARSSCSATDSSTVQEELVHFQKALESMATNLSDGAYLLFSSYGHFAGTLTFFIVIAIHNLKIWMEGSKIVTGTSWTYINSSLWEDEFQQWASRTNGILYLEGQCLMFYVFLPRHLDFVEDLNYSKYLNWAVVLGDECQHLSLLEHFGLVIMFATNTRLFLVSNGIEGFKNMMFKPWRQYVIVSENGKGNVAALSKCSWVNVKGELMMYTSDSGGCWSINKFKGHLLFPLDLCLEIMKDQICEQKDTGFNLIRGRIIPWKGWNDENNSNTLIMAKRSVAIISLCLSILDKNGQFKRILKLFHKMVNGLDPPKDLLMSSGVSMCLSCHHQWTRSWTSFLWRGWR